MAILAFLLKAIAAVLGAVVSFLMFVIIGRALASWFSADPNNGLVRFLIDATEPMLRPIRRYVPLVGPGIDLSPLILILALLFIQEFLVGLLSFYALKLATQ